MRPVFQPVAYRASAVKTIGNVLPDWTGGITNTFAYKGFDLSALIDIREGGEFFSTTHMWGTYSGILKTAANNIRDEGIVLAGNVYSAIDDDGTAQRQGLIRLQFPLCVGLLTTIPDLTHKMFLMPAM